MEIVDITISEDNVFTLHLNDGSTVDIPPSVARIIKRKLLLQELKCGISNIIDDEINGGYLSLNMYEGTREDFEDEIYVDLEDEIINDDYSALCNDGRYIREKVTDLADYYGLDPDLDEEGNC